MVASGSGGGREELSIAQWGFRAVKLFCLMLLWEILIWQTMHLSKPTELYNTHAIPNVNQGIHLTS